MPGQILNLSVEFIGRKSHYTPSPPPNAVHWKLPPPIACTQIYTFPDQLSADALKSFDLNRVTSPDRERGQIKWCDVFDLYLKVFSLMVPLTITWRVAPRCGCTISLVKRLTSPLQLLRCGVLTLLRNGIFWINFRGVKYVLWERRKGKVFCFQKKSLNT